MRLYYLDNMELLEIQTRKRELESKIETLVNDYQKDTGVLVDYIDVDHISIEKVVETVDFVHIKIRININ